jgi:hypothetical protein
MPVTDRPFGIAFAKRAHTFFTMPPPDFDV